MKYSFDANKTVFSEFIQEDYFPVIIEFSNEELNNLFIEFNYQDSDMFELSVNPNTFEIKRFSLTLCNHYAIKDASMKIPDYEEGALSFIGPTTTECSLFEVVVYNDGVEIRTSAEPASRHLKSGQLLFALTDKGELASVLITDLTPDNLNHIKTELSI